MLLRRLAVLLGCVAATVGVGVATDGGRSRGAVRRGPLLLAVAALAAVVLLLVGLPRILLLLLIRGLVLGGRWGRERGRRRARVGPLERATGEEEEELHVNFLSVI